MRNLYIIIKIDMSILREGYLMRHLLHYGLALALSLSVAACGKTDKSQEQKQEQTKTESAKTEAAKKEAAKPEVPKIKSDKGVDVSAKLIKIGILNDESGAAAVIGRPFGAGKRILAAQINAGKSGLLPEGWKVELVKRDHGYNPAKSQQGFDAIKNDVLFLGLSFGTTTTLPLTPFLKKDQIVAFPASLSSLMASNTFTPPAGPSYQVEAERAMDWIAQSAKKIKRVKAAIIYQQDDYGKDALKGWTESAKKHGIKVVAKRAIKPGQKDVTAEIKRLKRSRATHIYLAVLPSSTGPVLGTAAAMKFMPKWIGATPSWLDVFFAHPKLPAKVFTNFYWVTGMPFWGEKVPGMDQFMKVFNEHKGDARPDFYLLMSYVQGLFSIEVAKRAIEAGDITRAGYLKALKGVKSWNAGGLVQPIDMSAEPYVVSTKTRVLKPDFAKKTWSVVAGYAQPSVKEAKAKAKAQPKSKK
jgi:branched-chain amino acid transport system substrate-binding protein